MAQKPCRDKVPMFKNGADGETAAFIGGSQPVTVGEND